MAFTQNFIIYSDEETFNIFLRIGMLMKKKLIIFDADGTLWDSRDDLLASVNYVLTEMGTLNISKRALLNFNGFSMTSMYEALLPEEKKHLASICEELFRYHYFDECHFLDTVSLFPNVKDTIKTLKEQGFLMAICSRKAKRGLDKIVDHFELPAFSLVVGTEESNFKHKPDPEALNYIIDSLNLAKGECVMVGDSKIDIMAGKRADIDTVAVTYGYEEPEDLLSSYPTYSLDDFGDLKEILKV
jgi:phosphoglycolate phosphatase